MSYDGNDFQILINGNARYYDRVTLEVPFGGTFLPCEDLIIIDNVSLEEGQNLIQLRTNNVNAVAGTTFVAHAPIVDCVKISTSAVLTWDENYGVPALKNYTRGRAID